MQAYQDDGQQEEYHIDTGAFFVDNAPSWDELAQLVDQRMQETGDHCAMHYLYKIIYKLSYILARAGMAGIALSIAITASSFPHAGYQDVDADAEDGPTNSRALRRTFGQPGPPKLKLYR